jgi:hypothetical protein
MDDFEVVRSGGARSVATGPSGYTKAKKSGSQAPIGSVGWMYWGVPGRTIYPAVDELLLGFSHGGSRWDRLLLEIGARLKTKSDPVIALGHGLKIGPRKG